MPHECTNCGRTFENGSKQMLSGCPDCGGNKFQFQPAGKASAADAADSTADPAEPADQTPTADPAPAVDADDAATADTERELSELIQDDDPASVADAGAGTDRAADDSVPVEFDDEFEDAQIDDEVGEENSAQSDARSSSASFDEIDEARRKMEEAAEERLDEVAGQARGTPQGPPTDPPASEESEAFDISGAVGPDDGEPVEKQPVGGATGEPAEPVTDDDTDLAALREELNDQFESIKITAPGQYELNLMELYDRKEYIISLQEDGRYVIEMADSYGIDDDS